MRIRITIKSRVRFAFILIYIAFKELKQCRNSMGELHRLITRNRCDE